MTQEVDIGDVMRALSSAFDAKIEHDKQLAEYDGYSWGWHGAALIIEKDNSIELFGKRLDTYIDQRIQKALQSHIGNSV